MRRTSQGHPKMGTTHQPHRQAYARWPHQARGVHGLGYGRGSADLGYWWQIAWKDLDPEIVTRIQNGKDGITPVLFINELELAAAVVNYFAAATVIANGKTSFPWQPKVACSGDNTSALVQASLTAGDTILGIKVRY